MSKSVLILDDDENFSELLKDVFTNSGFEAVAVGQASEALSLLGERSFELAIIDQKLPDKTGAEFIKEAKEAQPQLPIVMLSGFLDNETVRELIRIGVGGVFTKPVNPISLIKKANELVEQAAAATRAPFEEDEEVDVSGVAQDLGFEFKSFPCVSPKSREFAEKLHGLKDFKSSLLVSGERGIHFKAICEDLMGFCDQSTSKFFFLDVSSFKESSLERYLKEAESNNFSEVTFVVLDTAALDPDQSRLLLKLNKKEAPFDWVRSTIRFVFCLTGELDYLYDEGLIDESLYLMMGTGEIKVPALRQCQEDLPVMMKQIFDREVERRGLPSAPKMEKGVRGLIKELDWMGNYIAFEAVAMGVMDHFEKGEPLSRRLIKKVIDESGLADPENKVTNLRDHLDQYREEYTKAVFLLCDGDRSKILKILDVEPALLDEIVSEH